MKLVSENTVVLQEGQKAVDINAVVLPEGQKDVGINAVVFDETPQILPEGLVAISPAELQDQTDQEVKSPSPSIQQSDSISISTTSSGADAPGIGLGVGLGIDAAGEGDGDGLAAMTLGGGEGSGEGAGQGSSNSSGSGEETMSLNQALTAFAEGEGEGEGNSNSKKGQGAEGQGAGGGGEAALGEDQSPKTQRKRGLMLQPLVDQLASGADEVKTSSTLLKNLSEGSVMGTNLLDALALGAGVLYVLYAPKAVETGKKGFRGLVNRVIKRGGVNAVIPEQNLLSVFVMKMPNGAERLMAARVGMGGMDVLAQQDLPADVRVDASGSQTQIDYAMKQLINKIGAPNADLLLLGPKLKGQASLLKTLAKQTQLLNTQDLTSSLSSCSATELEALQNWLNKPSSTPPETSPVYGQMLQQITAYTGGMPAEQANMAGLIELSVAMGWSQTSKAA